MKRIILLLLALWVMIIAATFYKGIAMAAQVTRINMSRGLIVIDGSKDAGFIMGATVCFYAASGEEVACGRIQQTSESFATVKVNNRDAKQIRYGMEAKIPVETSAEDVTKEDKRCVDDSECGANEICINGKCHKIK